MCNVKTAQVCLCFIVRHSVGLAEGKPNVETEKKVQVIDSLQQCLHNFASCMTVREASRVQQHAQELIGDCHGSSFNASLET